MTVRRGDIYWIAPDALRPTVPGLSHPHVVVQDDALNASRIPTVVVCGVSSQLNRAHEPGNVLLDEGEGELPRRSLVVVSQVCVVEKTELGAFVGRLSAKRVDQVLAGLAFVTRMSARSS
ncbi:MAG: type II toxin-antitoxin system PemK/MazF family toxin [Myxococcota bacterium]